MFVVCIYSCLYADDSPGDPSVWPPAAGAFRRGGGESGNSPSPKGSTELEDHRSRNQPLGEFGAAIQHFLPIIIIII